MNRFDIIELAQETLIFVYNTFNGEVNTLDPYTRLNFVAGYLDTKTNIARTTPYGYIYVSLEAFADTVEAHGFIDTDQIRNLALEIIIHELTHVDQLIDYSTLSSIMVIEMRLNSNVLNNLVNGY